MSLGFLGEYTALMPLDDAIDSRMVGTLRPWPAAEESGWDGIEAAHELATMCRDRDDDARI